MDKKRLQLDQLDRKLKVFASAQKIPIPQSGWLRTVRMSLGMSLQQLGVKLSITKQSVQEIEQREKEGSITLKSLRETADALDMQLVYGLVPKDGTIEALIERKAKELAMKIVSRTSNTMKLEDQENSNQHLKKAVEERTKTLINERPRILWD